MHPSAKEQIRRNLWEKQVDKAIARLTESVRTISKLVAHHDRQLNTAPNVSHSPQEAKTMDASTFIPEELQTALHRLNLTAITRTQWYEYQAMAVDLEKLRQKVADIEQIARSCHA